MNLNTIKFKTLYFAIFLFSSTVFAQITNDLKKHELSLQDFLHLVRENNMEYAAEKFTVNIADANALGAKVFPNPELSFEAFDNGQRRMKMGYGFSTQLEYTLELGGKRKARIHLANSESELTKILLEDYFRNLRADATLNYLEAIKQQKILDVKSSSYQTMKKLSDSDSIRLQFGSITEIDARQTKLEANSLLNELYQQEAEWKKALIHLNLFMGVQQIDSLYHPREDFKNLKREFNLQELIAIAKENRTDLLAALKNKDVSQKAMQLAKANRAIDLGIALGAEKNTLVENSIAPTPAFTKVSIGLSIPLKFSNKNKGELKTAQYAIEQGEILYKQTELQIQTEVMQYYYNYIATKKQAQQFSNGLLENAQKILEGKIYTYQRGESSLLEVLDAQRTYNEVQENYFETLNAFAAALVELERAVGIWDISF